MEKLLTISTSVRPSTVLLLCAFSSLALADGKTEVGGHTKLRLVGQDYPADSLFKDQYSRTSLNGIADLRLNLEYRQSGWALAGDYQLMAMNGETASAPDDRRRFFDLSSTLSEGSESAILHRLDRLWLGYSSDRVVVRAGRQVLSWGNGLFYAPMDLVNPFDPSAVDTEYKTGDDMIYVQIAHQGGADIQGAHVVRRDPTGGDVDSRFSTTAIKYHGFLGDGEFDVLLARHYDESVVGIGGIRALGGASLSTDIVVTDTDIDTIAQATLNLSYSWIAFEKNMTGSIEYHFNGFGQHSSRYDPASLALNPDLLRRLERGESFALGRHYIAGSLLLELTPLWSVSPLLLLNIQDPSALLQLTTNYSVSDNIVVLGSLSLPIGANRTEFGGPDSGIPGRFLSADAGVFAQIAWYF